jgi:hypothetical protein
MRATLSPPRREFIVCLVVCNTLLYLQTVPNIHNDRLISKLQFVVYRIEDKIEESHERQNKDKSHIFFSFDIIVTFLFLHATVESYL